MLFSPFSTLYQNIAATMVALGLTHADEAAFKTWAYSAWIDSGFTPYHCVLSQPATQLSIQFGVRVATSGHKVNVWWGDGTSNSYTPGTGANTSCAKTYGSTALRPVVVIGRVSRFESTNADGKTAFGGRVQGFGAALTSLLVTGSNTLSGYIAGLTALTFLNVQGSNTITGWAGCASAATGLCNLYHGGLTVLDATEVNAILAGFWANRNAAKSRSERVIDIGKDTPTPNAAPTGQGLTDKAALQAYRSPTPPGTAALWTVTTN